MKKEGKLIPPGTEFRTAVGANVGRAHDEKISQNADDDDGNQNDEKMDLLGLSEPVDLTGGERKGSKEHCEEK